MKHTIKLMGAILLMSAIGMTAFADWDPGDGHKMHYPQMPKVDGGWDVMSQYYVSVADDFQCSESGYINDIHTWISFKGDDNFSPDFETFHLAIWSDDAVGDGGAPGEDPGNTYSKPLELLWHADMAVTDPNFQMRHWASGDQGWFDPRFPENAIENDHTEVYQLNFFFDDIFYQTNGTIYWLEFSLQTPNEIYTPGQGLGWKESITNFNDAAVWRDPQTETWNKLVDPNSGEDIDMAFVITPEPTTVSMVALVGGLAVFIRRRVIG